MYHIDYIISIVSLNCLKISLINVFIITGCLSTVTGLLILAMDLIYPNRFSTILEVDYDTPYDRHIIIEDSHHKRKSGKTLEEPPGLGRRILR